MDARFHHRLDDTLPPVKRRVPMRMVTRPAISMEVYAKPPQQRGLYRRPAMGAAMAEMAALSQRWKKPPTTQNAEPMIHRMYAASHVGLWMIAPLASVPVAELSVPHVRRWPPTAMALPTIQMMDCMGWAGERVERRGRGRDRRSKARHSRPHSLPPAASPSRAGDSPLPRN